MQDVNFVIEGLKEMYHTFYDVYKVLSLWLCYGSGNIR